MKMKKIMMALAAVLCCTIGAIAQDKVEQALKYAEEMVKQADKKPKNGKLQLKAANALCSDDLGEKKDFDRAQTYADRALKIAMAQPALADTLKGLSSYTLGQIFLAKQNKANATEYLEMAMDAFEQELGKEDALTNGTKLIYSYLILGEQPFRAFPKIMEAFYYNSIAPKDKCIENMDEANILMETAFEMLVAYYTVFYRHALPMIEYNGKKCIVVQTADWNMERPLVGWLAPSFLRTEEENEDFDGDDTILCDDSSQFFVLPEEDEDKRKMTFNFKHVIGNPRKLKTNEDDARLWFFKPEIYNDILAKFREFKAKLNEPAKP